MGRPFLAPALLGALATGAAWAADAGVALPGTQPGELTEDIRPPELCEACHGGYAEQAANDSWKGSMMANAARDPLFQAALTIANQDVPGSGELCIRCHSPRAFLFGRASPPLIATLEKEDFESVSCDFCHRLTKGPTGTPLVGTGQYFVANDVVRRGPIADALAPHEWEHAPWFSESTFCAVCHDVSNPLQGNFAIERTYTEWASSAYAAEQKSCQSCHMPSAKGKACGAPGMPERELHVHELAGGNNWVPRVLSAEHPELGRGAAYERTALAAEKQLKSAASLELELPDGAEPGSTLSFAVRVVNLTGHKLPTGYPEGRRSWLEVVVRDGAGAVLLHSGRYDSASADRVEDPQLRTYEVRMASAGKEGFHFVLQDELLQDNRIPPRGFVPAPDTKPVGRQYPALADPAGGPARLAHWDVAPYSVSIPAGATGELEVSATLWYQTTSRPYVEFLRDANHSDGAGQRIAELWAKHGQSPPFAMASRSSKLALASAADAGPDASAAPPAVRPGGGCDCVLSVHSRGSLSGGSVLGWFIPVLGLLRRRRPPRRRKT